MGTISFARGAPAPELLPVGELADCARVALERDGAAVLAYGPAGGYPPLRAWLAERHGVVPERAVLTNGSLQGFLFLAEHLVSAGPARVLVEAPTYDRPLKLLARLGAEVVALPQDEDGLVVEAVEEALDEGPAAFLYTIPTFQNPSGRTLTAERRRALAALVRERGLLVLEDDPYGLVRFEGEAPPSLHELAAGEGVVYTSSFSKTVSPGLRVGYFVLPDELVAPFEAAAVSTYISPVTLGEATVWELIRRGAFEPNLVRVRGRLRARRDAMLDALENHFPEGTRWSRPEGGYFLWLELPDEADASELLARATDAGVPFVRGRDFYPDGRGASEARLAFSFASPDEIAEGIERLAALLPAAARR